MVTETVAYLGPVGSYSELALRNSLVDSNGFECKSIAEIFDRVDRGDVEAGLVPFENVIQGPVTETLDLLLHYRERVFISKSYLQQIVHVLGVLPSDPPVERSSIREIRSHFQALQQCSNYLDKMYQTALRVPTSSTSKAVEMILAENAHDVAAIASRELLKQNGFQIVAEDISDIADNQTRFMLIRRGNVATELAGISLSRGVNEGLYEGISANYVTSLVLNPGRDRQGLLHEVLTITSIKSRVNLLSIHSRPDAKGGFVFFLELEGHFRDKPICDCLAALEEFCRNSTGRTAEVIVFGSYLREPFFSTPFTTVGIIGGRGEMGRWFERFLRSAGLDVSVFDLDSTIDLATFVRKVQVVVLSVPMSQVGSLVDSMASMLEPGQLVVENCSVKNSALPKLLGSTKEGVEVLGLHTMFGGKVSELKGENIIITPTAKSGSMSQAFEDLFYKYGAHVHTASLEEHDRMTAHTQSLIHLILLSLGEVLERSYGNERNIAAFSTPNSRDVLTSLRRVLSQSDELISDLQLLNREASVIRHKFLEVFFKLTFALEYEELAALRNAADLGRKFVE